MTEPWRELVSYAEADAAERATIDRALAARPRLPAGAWRVLAVVLKRLTAQRAVAGELGSEYVAELAGIDHRHARRMLDLLDHAGVLELERSRGRHPSRVRVSRETRVSPAPVGELATRVSPAPVGGDGEIATRVSPAPVASPNPGISRPPMKEGMSFHGSMVQPTAVKSGGKISPEEHQRHDTPAPRASLPEQVISERLLRILPVDFRDALLTRPRDVELTQQAWRADFEQVRELVADLEGVHRPAPKNPEGFWRSGCRRIAGMRAEAER